MAYLLSQPHDKINLEATSNEDGTTALLIAAKEGRVDCVKLFVQHGANVAATTRVRNAILLYSLIDMNMY